MRAIIDSGSTKMEWIILEGMAVKTRFVSEGFNPNYADNQILENLVFHVKAHNLASLRIREILYYGTGCGSERNCQAIKVVLQRHFPDAEIMVTHDLMAACHALFGREEGIACILGTGSHSCVYDGKNITEKAVSLGYLVGDEGSGMHIGRELVRAYFYGLMPDDLRHEFENQYHLGLKDFVDNLYHEKQPSKYLASFAYFAGERQGNPFVHDLVKTCFKAYIDTFVCRFDNAKTLKISFVGSIAYHFQSILKETLDEYGYTLGRVMANPAEGLLRYYQNRQA